MRLAHCQRLTTNSDAAMLAETDLWNLKVHVQTLVFFHVQDDVPEVVASPALSSLPDVSHALLEQHFNPTNATTATLSPPHECQTRLNKSHHDGTASTVKNSLTCPSMQNKSQFTIHAATCTDQSHVPSTSAESSSLIQIVLNPTQLLRMRSLWMSLLRSLL